MLKKYEAKSQVNLSVQLGSGATAHVCFTPKTMGGSVFYTNDAALQEGLENHPRYGRLFKLVSAVEEAPAVVAPEPKKEDVKTMSFRNNEDAKDYFADQYGISRSKLRSRAAIEEAATAHGINLVWES